MSQSYLQGPVRYINILTWSEALSFFYLSIPKLEHKENNAK